MAFFRTIDRQRDPRIDLGAREQRRQQQQMQQQMLDKGRTAEPAQAPA
jgi:hypothetical protein